MLVLFAGCSELVEYGGILINSVNDYCYNADVYISISNTGNQQLSNFNISVIRDNDSLSISVRKISSSYYVTKISFPDEQIYPASSETRFVTVFAEHPYIGSFQQIIPVEILTENNPVFIEFNAGDIPDTLSPLPPYYYKQFNYLPY